MTCQEGKHCVRREHMVTRTACSSCAIHPGWLRETTTRRIMRDMRRKPDGNVVVGSPLALCDDAGRWFLTPQEAA